MKKVVSIDGVTLDNACFISSEFDANNFIGENIIAIDGSSISFVQAKGQFTKEVEVYSKNSGWISDVTKDLLLATVDLLAKTIVFSDATSLVYYYNHSKNPIIFESVYEGSLWYTVKINLLKG